MQEKKKLPTFKMQQHQKHYFRFRWCGDGLEPALFLQRLF